MATISSGPTQAIVGLADVFSKRAWPLVQLMGTSKNRRERRQFRLRSTAVRAYGEHRRPKVQRTAGFSRCPAVDGIHPDSRAAHDQCRSACHGSKRCWRHPSAITRSGGEVPTSSPTAPGSCCLSGTARAVNVKVVEIATGTAVRFRQGLPTVPLRWVLVRDPQAKLTPQVSLHRRDR